MKSFDQWLIDQAKPSNGGMLPENVWEDSNGRLVARCVCCEGVHPIYCDIDEIPRTDYRHYCGGSPHCMP